MAKDPNDEYWDKKVEEAYRDEVGDLSGILAKTNQELRKIAEWIAKKLGIGYQRVLDALRRIGGGSF